MNIEEITDRLVNFELGYSEFERLILTLLSKYTEDQGKDLLVGTRIKNWLTDAVAPKGIDNLRGPTLVEIKLFKGSPRVMSVRLRSAFDHLYMVAMEGAFRSVLLILNTKLSSRERQNIINRTPFADGILRI
jgi:hypothetical protein